MGRGIDTAPAPRGVGWGARSVLDLPLPSKNRMTPDDNGEAVCVVLLHYMYVTQEHLDRCAQQRTKQQHVKDL